MRVIIAEDSVIVRMGLERLLDHEGHEVVATVSRPEPLGAVVASLEPDAIVVDIRMPPTHTDEGLNAAATLRAQRPALGILVLSQYIVPEYALRLLENGEKYTGYLLKDRVMDPPQITKSLERVVAGGTAVDPELIASLFVARREDMAIRRLSERETEVLKHMAEGLSDKGISELLVLSPHTVGTHIQHIFRKLGLSDATAANRRVLATLSYLQSQRHGSQRPDWLP